MKAKVGPEEAAALRAGLRTKSRAELKRLFALVRRHEDRALLAALAPPRRRAGPPADPLVRELERALKPLMAPAREKADLLVEHMARKHRRKLDFEAKGLADAARRLRLKFTDEQIRAGANGLVARLAKLYDARETVA